MNQIIEQNIL